MQGNIFFLGNALLDISACCEESILRDFNLKSDENLEATSEHTPLFDYLLRRPNALFSPGGSAQNSARVAQWMFHSQRKGQSTFVGCIGNDAFGEKLQQFLTQSHVNALYDVHDTAPTGVTAAIVTNDAKRTLCARLGAASAFNSKYIASPKVILEMESADIIYVEGYFVSHSPLCATDIATFAETRSKTFAINLSATYICNTHFEPLHKCFVLADIVIGNIDEAAAFAHQCGIRASSAEECALALSELAGRPRIVIVTQGPDPVIVAHGKPNSSQMYDVPPLAKLGDTIGCGDAFVGGFLAAVSLEMPIDIAIRCGIYCATEIAKTRGCTLPVSDAKFIV